MIKVGIAEDTELTARVLTDIITKSDSIIVAWQAKNGLQTLDLLRTDSNIDVLLMDINMPQMGGIEATKIISEKWPHVKIVMCTVHDDEENIFNAILAGACGYLVKDKSPNYWVQAVIEAYNGEAPMSAGIAQKVLQLLRQGQPSKNIPKQDFGITQREKEILEYLVKGQTYEQIGASLFISLGTVRKHIEKIYRKLQVNNKIEAVQKAQNNRIV